ncbi:hypothetical protein OO009_06580 [Flavobacteriaceae bacterium KMM 6897]|nr:hypothetical protein [Flavobacteriaceae bacterium KMM 6897]MEB8345360.1 hypothetical protein [Flavobacteriaceae bacterium KMM 6898]
MTTDSFKEFQEVSVSDKSTCVLYLERNNKDVLHLNHMLACYKCEPRTYERFEQLAELKRRLQKLCKSNLKIISSLHKRKGSQMIGLDRIRKQFMKFNELQRLVEDYRNPGLMMG